ncbi:ATP-binding protein [Clostridium oceanicum]|uniref:ATP-binding protein n=1 Tax=Clostridium oceanicum TaxID=1543 RepID=A0ABN1JC25_9CLOT
MQDIKEIIKNQKMKELELSYDVKQIPKCPVCGEPIGIEVKTAFGTITGPRNCKCRREKLRKQELESKNKEKQMRLQRILKNSMLNKRFRESNFENWNHEVGNEKLFKLGKKYAYDFIKMKKENQGMLIYGEPGNGKTYFSASIANELLNRLIPVICVGAIGITERISQSKRNWGDEGIFTVLNSLDNADLLIIDDLGTEPDNKWTRSMMYQVIEKRNSSNLPVIVTTNISIDELKERYDDRTYSRLSEMCMFIRNTGPDIRMGKGKKKTKEFLEKLNK